MTSTPAALDQARLAALRQGEEADFIARHPKAGALHERATRTLLDGVPMNWMVRWAGAYPIYVEGASGAHLTDVDGHDYIDFCLGDTGAMAGHGAGPTVAAVERQLRRGITTMLPTEDAIWAGEELTRRFGLPYWQFTLSATDANRFSLRLARLITGRPLVAVHDRNYHGSVDETFAWLTPDGHVEARRGNAGPQVDPALTTRVAPFNDLEALEAALADGQVAALLIEPALTNIGIVLPEPGYLEGVREITRRHGTLLIHDETHTICAGPGGVTGAGGYEPDMLVIGKTIGGGIPVATYGMSADVAARVRAAIDPETPTWAASAAPSPATRCRWRPSRATLGEVLTAPAFERMIPLAERWEAGVNDVLARHDVPWHVTRLGARAEYHFMATRRATGASSGTTPTPSSSSSSTCGPSTGASS